MKKCDIVIPVWNQPKPTKECIDSITANTDCPYRLVIIDNGSECETADYLRGLSAQNGMDLLLVRNNKNIGFVRAVNQGMKLADAEYICVMNNDTIAAKGWLSELMLVMEARPEIGLLNPSSNTSNQSPEEGESIEAYAKGLDRFKGEIQELSVCRGFCMVIRKGVIERVGTFDEVYDLGYFEETDYSKKAALNGFRIARAKASYVYHKGSVSFKEVRGSDALFKKNESIFFERWGRQVRVAYLIERTGDRNKINGIVTDIARSGHQIIIFLKNGLDWPVDLDHFDIRRSDTNSLFFGIDSIYKILKRKRKKRIDLLLTENRLFGGFLKAIRPLHGAKVIVAPRREELVSLLKDRCVRRVEGLRPYGPIGREG